VLSRKDKFVERVKTVIKCKECKKETIRAFNKGDYIFKDLPDEKCEKCHKKGTLSIVEIFSEWYNPKKEL
jgi:predicted RNA-binding protein